MENLFQEKCIPEGNSESGKERGRGEKRIDGWGEGGRDNEDRDNGRKEEIKGADKSCRRKSALGKEREAEGFVRESFG